MSKRREAFTLCLASLVVFAPLLACKRKPAPGHHSATPSPGVTATAAPAVEPSAAVEEPVVDAPVIDASRATDAKLCIKAGKPAAISNETPQRLIGAMRSALRSLHSSQVYGATIMDIPEIKGWMFKVRASRELGLVYEAESSDPKKPAKIGVVQPPGGKTYARGAFLFSAHRDLPKTIGDQWFEVPEALLTADAGNAHPDGPKGVFGLNIGYKAAIAEFVQDALGWYPDKQADWVLASKHRVSVTKEPSSVDDTHRYFTGCQAVLLSQGLLKVRLSASDMPLPLEYDPRPGASAGHFRWWAFNKTFDKVKAPKDAVPLASLVAGH
jgi:hypothetical protein